MDYKEKALALHKTWAGKLEITSRAPLRTPEDLALAYTPGVAEPCKEIAQNAELSYTYTRRGNMVAVISDGSAVLGLGNIGALAAMPVMEGKCALFKRFGGVDAFPIVLDTQKEDEVIAAVKAIAPSFGGINLEDIASPRCFTIEKALKEALDIPVFHDDQHGTAVVVLAAFINALRLTGKKAENCTVVISGPGAAGNAICKLLHKAGLGNVIMCDRKGTLYKGREGMDFAKTELCEFTNKENLKGSLSDAMRGADFFVGVSAPNIVSGDMVRSMAKQPVVFGLANPVPEIMPAEALAAGAYIAGSGRSDFPNQVNNVLAFPGIFRGALDCRATAITESMKIAAAWALADSVK
ncbi:MAG: NAD-dependent malic enzyme, partial [Clostridiales bacterium]|nr:NAD-dependent malic enzyme [Clostridiales bacterium]